jgi:hypothetical protein
VHHALPRDNTALPPRDGVHGGGAEGGGAVGARAPPGAAVAAAAKEGRARYSAMPALLAGMGHAAAAAALAELAGQPLPGHVGAMSRGQRDDLWKACPRWSNAARSLPRAPAS